MLTETDTHDTEIRDFFHIPVGHFPDRSARWLFKEKENIRGLVEIVASELVEYLDFSRLVELNRSFVSDTLRELESDMVFSVPFQTASRTDDLLIYILIEHQSTVDPMMVFRVLFYMCQIWDVQRREWEASDVPRSEWRLRPILPIVYYTGAQRWQTPLSLTALMDMPEVLSRFVPRFDTLFLGVKETDAEDLTRTGHPLGWLLTVLQKEDADKAAMRDALRAALSHLDTLDPASAAQHRNAILYLCHLVLFRRPAAERQDLIQLVQTHTQDKEVESIMLTGAEALIEQGIEQGKAEGIEQGKAEGIEQGKTEGIEQGEIRAKQAAVIRLLRFQFPEVSDAVIDDIRTIADLSHLDTLFEQVLAATTLDDIDLPKHES
jgi:predicted transposase YdaD